MNTTYVQKNSTVQKADNTKAVSVLDSSSQSESLQRKADMANNAVQREEAMRPNNTGMPDNLKSGIESLSGFSMDDVRVHYNSSKPATVQALAYTQGTDIHVAPGQEKHLPHEAWHVAQQMAGRVSPTTNINGMPVNDNAALEHEADVMGDRAISLNISKNKKLTSNHPHNKTMVVGDVSQFVGQWEKKGQLEKWSNLRSGVRWYRYSDNGGWYRKVRWYSDNGKQYRKVIWCENKLWYKIENEDDIPQQFKEGYKAHCGEKLPRESWVKIHKQWADSELGKKGCPKFGMEAELDRNGTHGFYVDENTPEDTFKAKRLFTIVDGLVDVTFDTPANYEVQNQTEKIDLVIEMVFNALKIPLSDDLYAIGENFVHEIQNLTYKYIEDCRDQKIGGSKIHKGNKSNPTSPYEGNVIRSTYPTLGIHVTVACPLRNIFKVKKIDDKTPYSVQSDNTDDEVEAFFKLLNSITTDPDSSENLKNDDPKSNMEIMNRTSFGKIFSMMSQAAKQKVLEDFEAEVKDFHYGKKGYEVSKFNLLQGLRTINNGLKQSEPPSKFDPSYLAATKEKYGISGLGDDTESINGEECPIFEFRESFNFNSKKLDEFPTFVQKIANLFFDKGIQHGRNDK